MSQEPQAGLLLLGVGGGGCRLTASVLAAYGGRLRALGVDTDALSNRQAAAGGLNCLLLGGTRLAGHGTGGDPIKGRLAAQDDIASLEPHLQGVRTAVVLTCLGGGTGGGAAPELIKALHDMGVVTLCFAALPFGFEGDARRKAAERALPLVEENADSLVTVPLDDLFRDVGGELLEVAIGRAEAALAAGLTLLWRLLTRPGFIRLDAERLHALVVRGGNARFGTAAAAGEGRAARAVAELRASRLLRGGEALAKADALLVGVLAGADLRLAELGELMGALKALCGRACRVEMGTVLDPQFDGRVEVVALAFENWVISAQPEARKEAAATLPEPPVAEAFPIHSGARKGRGKGSKLSFGTTGRGKFQHVEPTLLDGQDYDIPTFIRRGMLLER